MTWLISNAARFSVLILLSLFAITGLFSTQLSQLELNVSFDKMMIEGDNERASFEEFRQVYGQAESILLFVNDDDLFNSDNISLLSKTLSEIKKLSDVKTVLSLFSLNDVQINDDGEVLSKPYLDASNLPIVNKEAWVKRLTSDPIISNQFLSNDGHAIAVIIELTSLPSEASRDTRIIKQLETLTGSLKTQFDTVVVIGPPNLRHSINEKVIHDQEIILPIALGGLVLLLALILKKVNGAIIPVLTGVMSAVWTLGLMAFLGVELNVMTSIVPVLLIIVGSTEDMHLMSEYYSARNKGLNKKQAIIYMADEVGVAVFLTFLTTALGFLSIALNPIEILQEFGLMAGFGLAANFLITTLLVPAWLQLFSSNKTKTVIKVTDGFYQKFAIMLMGWVLKSKRLLVGVVVVIALWSLAGAVQVKVDNNPLNFLGSDDDIVLNRALLEDKLAGSHRFSIDFDAQIQGTFLKVEYLSKVLELQHFIDKTGLFSKTFSFADIMTKVNVVMEEDDSGNFYLPYADDVLNDYLLFVDREDIASFVSEDYSRTRITVQHTINGSFELNKAIDVINDYVKKNNIKGVRINITGDEIMTNHATNFMALGQVISLAMVFLIIGLLISALFVNWQAGLIALIPNIIPVFILFGVMGWFDIALDTSTAMVAAIALGICVDDTMHFMVRFHQCNSGKSDTLLALEETVRHEALPIFSTSLALTAGFSLLALSSFPPVANFGLLSALMMVVAFLSTFLVTPLLLSTIRLVSLWDMFDLQLQDKVSNNCGLFTNMSTWQIKKMILLSDIQKVEAGETLFCQGDAGDRLFVVLSGKVELWQEDIDGLHVLSQLGEGDVFGEMSMVRRQPRSSSALAINQSQFLVLSWDDVERIKRLNPRIAAKLFLNLSSVLGSRLDTTMARL